MDLDEFNLMGLHVPVKQGQSFIYIPYFWTYKTLFSPKNLSEKWNASYMLVHLTC
jgi:hypothetical protein